MITQKYYVYIGTNGAIQSPVLLENIAHSERYFLKASNGKQLTKDNINFVDSIMVSKDDLSLWKEV